MNDKHSKDDKHLNYENYSVEDFAADQDFVRWVKNPDDHSTMLWQRWLKQHPHKQATIEEARMLVQSIGFSHHPDMQSAVEMTWERIKATNHQQQDSENGRIKSSQHISWWKMAAVLAGILLIAGGVFYTFSDRATMYQTKSGETSKIQLPDGSVVTLNANSTLKVGKWEKDREVWLKGEAFFSVRKKTSVADSLQPVKFIVHTNTLDVSVLGTEFTVSERSKTMVVLNAGKIELTLPDKHIIMKPGDLVEISGTQKELVQRTVDPEVYSAWKNNEWILDGLTLEQIAERIEDTYSLKVVIKNNPDPKVEITGVVPTDNLETLLDALSAAFDLTFEQQGHEVLIE